MIKDVLRGFARGPGHAIYAQSGGVLRYACRRPAGQRLVIGGMRAFGSALFWMFDGKAQSHPEAVTRQWQRILSDLGLEPEDSIACTTCFSRCTLGLGLGDSSVCDAAMAINDELIDRLGGRMRIDERRTEVGKTRCVVRIEAKSEGHSEQREPPPWCDEVTAQWHFEGIAKRYDYIMGYFEVQANRRAVGRLHFPDRPHIVELGVGTGLGLLQLVKQLPKGGRVTAVDTSAAMLEQAHNRLRKYGLADRVTFVRADAARLDLPAESADIVYSSFLLDLLDSQKRSRVLEEVRRILKPGGTGCFVVMDGNASAWHDRVLARLYELGYGRWNPLWQRLLDGYAPHCRPIDLARDLGRKGFIIERRSRSYVMMFPVAIYHCRSSSIGWPKTPDPANTA